MRVKLNTVYLAILALIVLASPVFPSEAQPIALGQPVKGIEIPFDLEIDDLVNITVMDNGLTKVDEVVKSTATGYLFLKQQYPLPFLFKRFILLDKADIEVENLTVNFDDVNRRITSSYIALGMTRKRMGKWEFLLQGDAKLTTRAGNTLVFSETFPLPYGGKKNVIITVRLPDTASSVSITSEEGYTKITYELPSTQGLTGNIWLLGLIGVLVVLLILNLALKDGLLGLFRRSKSKEVSPL